MKWFRVTLRVGGMHYLRGTDEDQVRQRFERDYPALGRVYSVRFLRNDN